MIAFEDDDNKLVLYNILTKSIEAVSEPLKKNPVYKKLIKSEPITHNTAWCIAGDIIVMQRNGQLLVKSLPYLCFEQSN